MRKKLFVVSLAALGLIAGTSAFAKDKAPGPEKPGKANVAPMKISWELLREIPVEGMLAHPISPPESGRSIGPDFEHPMWPPEAFKGDLSFRLADGGAMLTLPSATLRSWALAASPARRLPEREAFVH